jgi:hypothetical protein
MFIIVAVGVKVEYIFANIVVENGGDQLDLWQV